VFGGKQSDRLPPVRLCADTKDETGADWFSPRKIMEKGGASVAEWNHFVRSYLRV